MIESVLFWVFLVIGAIAAFVPNVAWSGRLVWACVFICVFILGLNPFH